MTLTNEELQEHTENLRDALRRKVRALEECHSPAGRTSLRAQAEALRNRVLELNQQIAEAEQTRMGER